MRHMTPEQLQEFKAILERAESLSVRALLEDREDMWREPRAGVSDESSTTGGQGVAPGDLGHRAGPLREIREALARISHHGGSKKPLHLA